MSTTTITQKYQVVIPKGVREKVDVKEGQKLYVYPLGDSIVLSPKPKSFTEHMLGLGKEIWEDIDPLDYIRKQRAEWNQQKCLKVLTNLSRDTKLSALIQ